MAEQLKFPGFPEKPVENYWQYPKVMNGYWHQLTGTEQKVLDYILRHTWGYQKTADRISLSQFKNGIIIKKTDERIDWGIGIKRNEDILKAIKRLEELGFIKTFQQKGKTKEFSLVRQVNKPCPTGEQVACPTGEHTINNYTINNRQYVSKETEKSPPSYGNKEINDLILLLKAEYDIKLLDGSEKENRRFCWLALKKFKRSGVEAIIKIGARDKFWKTKITDFKTLYYNGVKIASTLREKQQQVVKI